MCFLCCLESSKVSGRGVTGKGQAAIPSSRDCELVLGRYEDG